MSDLVLCDTHAHLSDEAYDNDRVEVARCALASGLAFVVDVGTNPETWRTSRALAQTVDGVYVTVGYHPHDAASVDMDALTATLDAAWWEKSVAVGEMGLDFHYDFSPRSAQCSVFEAQLEYAARKGVPSIIHIREAWHEALAILRAADLSAGGVVHCFTGSYEEARAVLSLGLHISLTGVVSFPRSTDLREVVKRLPLDRLFVETDSPYLSPPPYRGRRNHPQYVRHIVETLAETFGLPSARIAEETTEQARLFFGVSR